MSTIPFSSASRIISSSGSFPRTKTITRISIISAVRITCGLTSPVRRIPCSFTKANTSLIKSLPQALLISMSSSICFVLNSASKSCWIVDSFIITPLLKFFLPFYFMLNFHLLYLDTFIITCKNMIIKRNISCNLSSFQNNILLARTQKKGYNTY